MKIIKILFIILLTCSQLCAFFIPFTTEERVKQAKAIAIIETLDDRDYDAGFSQAKVIEGIAGLETGQIIIIFTGHGFDGRDPYFNEKGKRYFIYLTLEEERLVTVQSFIDALEINGDKVKKESYDEVNPVESLDEKIKNTKQLLEKFEKKGKIDVSTLWKPKTTPPEERTGYKIRQELINKKLALIDVRESYDDGKIQLNIYTCPQSGFDANPSWNGETKSPKPIEFLIKKAKSLAQKKLMEVTFESLIIYACEDDPSKKYVVVSFLPMDQDSETILDPVYLLMNGVLINKIQRSLTELESEEFRKFRIPEPTIIKKKTSPDTHPSPADSTKEIEDKTTKDPASK